MNLVISGLARHHDRLDFDCGEPALNIFLQRLARQQADRDHSRTYVATAPGESRIRGFYAVSSSSVNFENWPADLKLPRYPMPVARLGRLAVDVREQGSGVGAALLLHAMQLTVQLAQHIGLFAVVVDAKNEAAAAFYERYGFGRFPDQKMSLFISTAVIRRALASHPSGASH
ncbi:MAG: GNAT family N-acetyltransferase [Rhodoferax sp.]